MVRRSKKIPVVKSRVEIKESRSHSRLVIFTLIVVSLLLMLFYIWLKFEMNLLLGDIQRLERENKRILDENDQLQAEVVRLSSYGRIRKIATGQLELVFIPHDDIIEVQ
ncbi:cell division protein FtsL [candidate division KSB1 bacterium]|nr:cell division protein FtsL [candidate division KSB1 bacterium]NIR71836.1 cell division protein FtsL [candidate division KSB1 bacterium]NIS25352.1 cell division protein FtsL [candidate division KSB1 bacterium]NIT71822.1 cell division protein FtsL [candidate division KSB1 bacterium]NIU25560.1 cell division protein FtsL [candidate division KSB1 bacterium]